MPQHRFATLHSLWIVALCLVASGCIPEQKIWQYRADRYPPAPQLLTQKRLVVPPFKDSRPDSNENASWLMLIPLMPYGWVDYSLPEAATEFPLKSDSTQQFKPKEDLAGAVAEELRGSGIFKEVVVAPRAVEGELVLYGEVKSTRYYGTTLSYGLSILAGFPWMIGLPAGKITNELVVEFYLEDSGTNTVLWRREYEEAYKATYWMPYSIPQQFNYAALYKNMLQKVVKSLRAELTSHP